MLVFAALIMGAPGVAFAQGGRKELPPGEGREIVQRVCTQCHTLTPVLMKTDGEGGWRHTVTRMVLQRQAQLLPAEFETVVKYLATSLGPGVWQMTSGPLPPGASALPEGPGKQVVTARCSICHDLTRVTSVRRKAQEWEGVVRNMIDRGPQAPPDQVKTIVSYLTTHFLEADQ
jgi:mono/diheme cytochrome c family protein